MPYKKLGFILSLALFIFFYTGEIAGAPIPLNQIDSSLNYKFALPKEYILNIDGQELSATLFINNFERTMISTTELARVFNCSIDWSDSNQIYVKKDDRYWCFTVNNLTCFSDSDPIIMDTAPVLIDEEIYIPLRYIVQEFGYFITFCPNHSRYFLSSSQLESLELECEKPVPMEELTPPDKLPLWGNLNETEALHNLYTGQKLIAGYYTTLINSSPARTNNIVIAAQAIDNVIIPPGKVFSFNYTVGPRTTSKGYQEAPIFVGEKVVSGVGGGICQVSSTLYNTALAANLPVLERYPHSLRVAYVPTNRDASVSWGAADFKFQNPYDYPVKLMVKVFGKYVVTGVFRSEELGVRGEVNE